MTATLLLISLFVLSGCGADARASITMDHYPSSVPSAASAAEADLEEVGQQTDTQAEQLYIILGIDTERCLIRFGMPDAVRSVQYGYTQATQILDGHGAYISIGKLSAGRVVTLGELDSQAKLTTVQLAPQTVYQENITRFSLDASIGMLVIGDTKYKYDAYTRVFSGEQEIAMTQLKEGDVLSATLLDKQILSVQVTVGHGTLALKNTELFEDGWISLGTEIYTRITPNMTLEVPEGTYELSVANDGYGDTKTVEVTRAQVTTVDLDEYKGEGPKLCKVTFEVHIEDAQLYVDGEKISYKKPVELRYGVHQLSVIADGFETWERQLVIHSEDAVIQIGEPQLTDTEDKDDETEKPVAKESSEINSHLSGDDAEKQTSSERAETSADASGTSSSASYSDYLDTLSDLVKSLTGSTAQ